MGKEIGFEFSYENKQVPEKKFPNRENDIEFSHIIVNKLNEFIDSEILSNESVSNASFEAMDEFVGRFEYQILHNNFDKADEEKVKTLFGARVYEKDEPTQESRERIVSQLRVFLQELRDSDNAETPITGILFFGSQMDFEKTPKKSGEELSDIDTIYYAVPPPGHQYLSKEQTWDLQDLVKSKADNHQEALGHSFDIQEWGMRSINELLEDLVNTNQEDSVPVWAWKPKGAYYIGDTPAHSEEQINKLLQEYLTSSMLKKQKEKVIDFVKKCIQHDNNNPKD